MEVMSFSMSLGYEKEVADILAKRGSLTAKDAEIEQQRRDNIKRLLQVDTDVTEANKRLEQEIHAREERRTQDVKDWEEVDQKQLQEAGELVTKANSSLGRGGIKVYSPGNQEGGMLGAVIEKILTKK
jgi:hypothetical protein